MAGRIPVGTLATDIKLDINQPKESLTTLNRIVKQNVAAIKAQTAEFKNAGKSVDAAKARYEGFTKALKAQTAVINKIKNEQKKLDRSTANGAEKYTQLTNKLTSAETKYTSLAASQRKAKSDMDYYKSGLADLQKECNTYTRYAKDYIARLKAEGNEYKASSIKMSSYKNAIANLVKQQKIQQEELKGIAKETGTASAAYKKQQDRVNLTAKSLAELKNKQKDVRSEYSKFHPTGIDKLDKSIDKVRLNTSKLGDSFKSSFSKIKGYAAVAGTAIVGVGTFAMQGAKKAEALQKSYVENTNLLISSGEKVKDVTKEISSMQRQGREYSIKYGESQKSIAGGYEELIKRGYSGKQSLGAMNAVLQASRASGDSFNDTMHVTTSTLEAFGMKNTSVKGMMKSTSIVANELAVAANATSTSFADLGIGMNYVGTSAKTAGISLTDAASTMGVLSNSGLEAQQAGTGLRKVLNSLMNPGDKNAVPLMKKYGIDPEDFRKADGSLKPIAEDFDLINKKVPKSKQADFFHIVFGTTGQNAAAILATHVKDLKEVNSQVAKAYSQDYIGKTAKKNMEAVKNQEKSAKMAMEDAQLNIGKAVMPAISKASISIMKILRSKDAQNALTAISKGIADIAMKAADFIAWLGKSKNRQTFITIGKVLLTAFAGAKLLKGIATTKKTIIDLVGETNLSKIKSFANKGGNYLKDFAKNSANNITSAFKNKAWPAIKDFFTKFKDGIANLSSKIVDFSKIAIKKFKDIASNNNLFNQNTSGKLTGILQSTHSAGGFSKLTTAGKIATSAAGIGIGIDAIGNVINGLNAKTESGKYIGVGKGIGAAIGGGLAGWFLGPEAAPIGATIGKKVGSWGGQAVLNFQKGWNSKKPPSKFWSLENLGWSTKNTIRKAKKAGQDAQKNLQKGWKEKRPPKNFWSLENLGWSAHSMFDGFKLKVQDAIKWFQNKWQGLLSWFNNTKKDIGKGWGNFTKELSKGHFASGTGPITEPTMAVLNDGQDSPQTDNREGLLYPNGLLEILSGKNVRRLLMPGMQVIKASDMAHIFHFANGTFNLPSTSVRLIEIIENILKAIISTKNQAKIVSSVRNISSSSQITSNLNREGFKGTEKQVKKLAKSIDENPFGNKISEQAKFAVETLKGKGNFSKQLSKMNDKSTKDIKKFSKDTSDTWKSLWDTTDKKFKSWRNNSLSGQKNYNSSFIKGWKSIDSGVKSEFGHFWTTMHHLSVSGLNDVIKAVNSGVSSINSVIGSFGGNNHAVGYATHVKYATGTGYFSNQRRAITKPTLAILNDGNDSPETNNREAVYRPSTGQLGVINGTNVTALLAPGDEVFNAAETKLLGLIHFASGTGYLKKLYEEAKTYNSKPKKTLSKLLRFSNTNHGGLKAIDEGLFKKTDEQAVNWWSQLWKMADDKINDSGSSSALLRAVEKYGEGHSYVWGAHGPDTFDCSGLVEYALKKAFGITLSAPSGSQYAATQHIFKSQAHSGDLVFWGSGGSEHVGVYAGGNKYFSAESPSQGIHMNTLNSVVGKGSPLFGRVKGLKQDDNSKQVKGDSALDKKIRTQVGQGFWKTIDKIADKFGVNEMAGTPSGDKTHWLKQAHIPESWWPKLSQMIQAESNWDPKATNGNHWGLGQMSAENMHYYTAHGSASNAIAQLMGIKDYIIDRYGGIDQAYAFRQAHNWYANGGFANRASIFGEAGPEVAIPLLSTKSTRAWELVGKTIAILTQHSGLGSNFDSSEYRQQQKEDKQFKQQILFLLQQLVSNNDVPLDVKVDIDGRTAWQALKKYAKRDINSSVNATKRGLSGA